MIPDIRLATVVRWALERWEGWFGVRPGRLRWAVVRGGPSHQSRLFLLLRTQRHRAWVKFALSPREANFLAYEYQALVRVRALVPEELALSIPTPLGEFVEGGGYGFAEQLVPGARVRLPDLTAERGSGRTNLQLSRYLNSSFAWAKALSRGTLTGDRGDVHVLEDRGLQFAATFGRTSAERADLRRFARAVGNERISWDCSWQHRDLMVSNVLVHKSKLRVLDWEHASPGTEPWFDTAYGPIALAHVVSWQRPEFSPSDLYQAVTAPGTPLKGVIDAALDAAWCWPLPPTSGVALTAMAAAMRQEQEIRSGAALFATFAIRLLAEHGS